MCAPHQSQAGASSGGAKLFGVIVIVALVLAAPQVEQANKTGKRINPAGIVAGLFSGANLKLPQLGQAPGTGGGACPVKGRVRFSDTWGAPRSGGRRHQGVDMFAGHGTRLVAVTTGRIVRAGWNQLGGLGVTLRDARGTSYYYAHLSSKTVHAGQRVKRGQLIGRVGNTGNARSTPSHLHFEVRPGGRAVNPTGYVRSWC